MENDEQMVDTNRNIVFLSDAPKNHDEFKGGAHERVASAVVDTIKESESGRAIGLEGTWGSGKSTVVEIIGGKLKEFSESDSKKYFLFLFDSWAHQGDPVRRTFLEELIIGLGEQDAINLSNWNDELKRIRSRIKRTQISSAKNLTALAKFGILYVPFLPLGYIALTPEAAKKSDPFLSLPFWEWGVLFIRPVAKVW